MARSFSGTDHLEVPSAAAYQIANGTLAFWFMETDQAALRYITSRTTALDLSGVFMYMNTPNGNVSYKIRDASGNVLNLFGGVIAVNTWNHLVFTWGQASGATCTGYINGVQDATGTTSGPWTFSAQVVRIGQTLSTNTAFTGRVAEYAWWNVNLSHAEIIALSNGTPPIQIRTNALVLYLPIWGNSPEADLSGNKNNATVTGTARANHAPVDPYYPWPTSGVVASPAVPPQMMLLRVGGTMG